jgi:hypothetical protein
MTLPAPGAPAAPARALALADATPSAIPEALRGELRPETGAEPARPLRTADAVAGVRTGALAGALVTGFLVADLGVALGLPALVALGLGLGGVAVVLGALVAVFDFTVRAMGASYA